MSTSRPLPRAIRVEPLANRPTVEGILPEKSSTTHEPRVASRPVLGLLIDCTGDSYQNGLLLALAAAAERRGASLLCFVGGAPGSGGVRNRAYDLVGSASVDALIVSAGTLETGAGQPQLLNFCQRFIGIPTVSIGLALPSVPSVLMDNTSGTYQIVDHLLKEHGCRRPAFIGGPPSNDEARARQAGYRQALFDAGLEYDARLETVGDFLFESGRAAVRAFLDERSMSFDAVVAANDDMALGALCELQLRGYRVPDDIAVVGFDDSPEGSCSNPPLTTLRQPIQEQADAAVELALRQLEGTTSLSNVQLKTQLVRRRSCGCSLEHRHFAVEQPRHPRKGDEESPLLHKRAELVHDVLEAGGPLLDATEADTLVAAFLAELRGKPEHPFMGAWEGVVRRATDADLDLAGFQAVASALRKGAVPSLVGLGGILTRAETLIHESRVLLAHAMQQSALRARLAQQRSWHVLSDVAQSLITCTELSQLEECLARAVPALLIPSCFLAWDGPAASPDKSRLGSFDHLVQIFPRLPGPHRQRTEQPVLLNALRARLGLGFETPRAFVLEPLFYGTHWYGVLVLELGPGDGSVYEALRSQLSAGIHAVTLGEQEAQSSEMYRQFWQRGGAHAEGLQRVLRGLEQSQRAARADGGQEAEQAFRAAVEALADLVSEWSNIVGRARDTERAPPGARR